MNHGSVGARSGRILGGLALASGVCALTIGVETVRGLEWPYDGDHYRDIAQAQRARDGHPLSDPHYRGEWIWYNPLVPWTVGAGSAIFGFTPSKFHVQSGPWLNLIAPGAFYALASRLAGSGAAFAAVVIFLFFNCQNDPALTCPTYSPWLFVATFSQGLFFLALLPLSLAENKLDDRRALLIGMLGGLTFLAHTAPALVLAAVAVATLPRRALLIAGVAAVIVASPFLYSIVWHYRLQVLNDGPMGWRWPPVTLSGMPATLRANALLIAAGFAGLFVVRKRIIRIWLGASLALLAYGLARDLVSWLPPIVPAFHFWRYTMAALTLLAGATAWMLVEQVFGRYAVVVGAALATTAVALSLPDYRTRFDLVYGQSISARRAPLHDQLTNFLRKSTSPDSIILGSRGASLMIIGPAGRNVVAVNANWSNPYLDNASVVHARDAMLDSLRTGADEQFLELAKLYHVTHVVGIGRTECTDFGNSQRVQLLYDFGEACVFSVNAVSP